MAPPPPSQRPGLAFTSPFSSFFYLPLFFFWVSDGFGINNKRRRAGVAPPPFLLFLTKPRKKRYYALSKSLWLPVLFGKYAVPQHLVRKPPVAFHSKKKGFHGGEPASIELFHGGGGSSMQKETQAAFGMFQSRGKETKASEGGF